MNPFAFSSFVIVFRETLEAALIVAIVLTFLSRLGASSYRNYVLGSALGAVLASAVAARLFEQSVGAFEGRAAEIFEGIFSLSVAAVLTYMIFWMHRQAARIRSEIEEHVQGAVGRNDLWALMGLPFFAVLREGAETILFLKAAAFQNGGTVSFTGGVMGFGGAIALVAMIFWLGKRIPLRPFFQGTGFLLTLIAAGMLAYGIHELEEAAWIPFMIEHIWDLNGILSEKEGIGSFLKAIFGYNANPSLGETFAYFGYLALILGITLRRAKGSQVLVSAEAP